MLHNNTAKKRHLQGHQLTAQVAMTDKVSRSRLGKLATIGQQRIMIIGNFSLPYATQPRLLRKSTFKNSLIDKTIT